MGPSMFTYLRALEPRHYYGRRDIVWIVCKDLLDQRAWDKLSIQWVTKIAQIMRKNISKFYKNKDNAL